MINEDFREKYRPRSLREVIGNGIIKKAIAGMVETGKIRRGILLVGPAGSGKTTLARILVKALHCRKFSGGDACGTCEECSSFERKFPASDDYWFHDCSKVSRNDLEETIRNLRLFVPISSTGLNIHMFDEFHRAKEPLQDKFLVPLETYDNILLIFCLIEPKAISRAFRQRVLSLPTNPPEIDELVPWLQGICTAESIVIRDNTALREVARSCGRLPRECLSLLEQVHLLGEPLSTNLVRDLAQNIREGKYTLVD